jgi:ABC-type sugar transport system substrate-binding protein
MATVGFVGVVASAGCGTEDHVPQDTTAIDCATHSMRPDRYKLFEIVDKLKTLTKNVADPPSEAIYLIPGHWSEFWEVPKAGFEAAKTEMGFSGAFKAACDKADTTCVQDQMRLFSELTDGDPDNGEADAIGISCKGATEMAPLIAKAVEHTPIITFDADVGTPIDTGRHLYLGAMNLPAGRDAGETMFRLLDSGGTVHLFAQTYSSMNLAERAAGVFSTCLGTSFATAAEFLESESCTELETRGLCEADCAGTASGVHMVVHFYAEELKADTDWLDTHEGASGEDYLADCVANLLSGDNPPVGLVSLQGTPSPIVSKALAESKDATSVRLVAWDMSPEVQSGLERGTVAAAMVQNAYFYGYVTGHIAYAMAANSVSSVMEILKDYFEPTSDDHLLDTGMTIVTPENLPFYLQYQVECLGLRAE